MRRLRVVLVVFLVAAAFVFVLSGITSAQQGNPNEDCPAGTDLIAKFEWEDGGYVFEKPSGNEDVVTIDGDEVEADWWSTMAVGYVILKGGTGTHTYEYMPAAYDGSFSKTDLPTVGVGNYPDISNVQFCGVPEVPPEDGLTILLDPRSATNILPMDDTHTVTATVRDEEGMVVEGVIVWFAVTGVHTEMGSDETDENGLATFTYTGVEEGTDTIKAWIDDDEVEGFSDGDPWDEVTKEWERDTSVSLDYFIGKAGVGKAFLGWKTGTEVNNAGFNVYRASSVDGPYEKVNGALIVAQGDPVSGARYRFIDSAASPGTTYYRLEDVDLNGGSTLHGPVSVRIVSRFRAPAFRPMVPR